MLSGILRDIADGRHSERLLDTHAGIVERIVQGEDHTQVLIDLAGVTRDETAAAQCVVEACRHDRGLPPLVLSPEGVIDDAPEPAPGHAVSRTTLTSRDGEEVGSLVLHLAAGNSLADDLVDRTARLATMALVRANEHRRMSQSVALLEATLESTEDGILVVDSDGRTAGHNQKFAEMWRIDPELLDSRDDARMIGYVLGQLVDPDGFVSQVMELYDSPTETSFDELHFLDGRVFERYSQPQLVRGQSVGRVWSFRDVTDKRRLQSELELLGSVATASNAARSVEDALRETLAACCEYGGWALGHALIASDVSGESLGRSVWHEQTPGQFTDFRELTEQHSPSDLKLLAEVLESGRPVSMSFPEVRPTSARAEAAIEQGAKTMFGFPILDRHEVIGVLEFVGTVEQRLDERELLAAQQVGAQIGRVLERDRAERRLARHARKLERLTHELESVLNSAGEGIYGLDATGTITFVNETAARLVGMPREAMLGRQVDEVIRMERQAPEAASLDGEAPRAVCGRHLRADGTTFESELIAAPLLEDGVAVGSVVVFRDVTERRAVDRMKDEFISVVSHELRTPLTSIRGALGLLAAGAAGEIPPQAARMVEVATTSTERLIRLINDILDVERMAVGKLAIHPVPTEAGQLLRTAVEEMAGLAQSSGVEIHVSAVEGTVLADPDRIVQTLSNLLSNAIKFSDAGDLVELRATAADGFVRFDIRDNGPGIPSDQLESVFEHFRQVDGSDTRQKGGTGLGLAICRGLVDEHGGRIWATSHVGEGTTISFVLPRIEGETSR